MLIVAGEASADIHGANLVRAVRRLDPGVAFQGIGGPRMAEAGVDILIPSSEMAVVGLTEVIPRLARIHSAARRIKNILQGIRGGSYLIELGLSEEDPSVVRRGWTIVEKNQNKISQLVMDMLTFSKEREPDLAPAEINQVVGDVVELMQVRANDLDVQLRWYPDESIPTLVFDAEGLHRAVLNVVTNAIDAACEAPEGSVPLVEVETALEPTEGKVRVGVKDNGPGVPPEQVEQLFSPFVSSKRGRGTGLGLPVSHKILNEHGGRIVVESQPGEGARFTLELPAVRVEAPSQTRAT